jgi:hypothetical protein
MILSPQTLTKTFTMNKATEVDVRTTFSLALGFYQSIMDKVEALHVDYDRLRELKVEREALSAQKKAVKLLTDSWIKRHGSELRELERRAGGRTSYRDVARSIRKEPTAVSGHPGWPGIVPKQGKFHLLFGDTPTSFEISGEVNGAGKPVTARVYCHDSRGKREILPLGALRAGAALEYCQQFDFSNE